MPENDVANLISGAHVRVYASTDMRHLILEIGASGGRAATIVRLAEPNARNLIGQLQSGVEMIRSVDAVATPAALPAP